MTSTTTQLAKFRSQQQFDRPISISANATFRELWADGLATVATVTLFAILVFDVLRLLIQ
jgi:hypothetical protein